MLFQVDPESRTPIYAQIMRRIEWGALTGALQHGDQLPSVRELATRLRVNPNTVVKAYRELEHEGVVESRRGQGTFIAAESEATARGKEALAREALVHAAEVALAIGYSAKDAEGLFSRMIADTQARIGKQQEGER